MTPIFSKEPQSIRLLMPSDAVCCFRAAEFARRRQGCRRHIERTCILDKQHCSVCGIDADNNLGEPNVGEENGNSAAKADEFKLIDHCDTSAIWIANRQESGLSKRERIAKGKHVRAIGNDKLRRRGRVVCKTPAFASEHCGRVRERTKRFKVESKDATVLVGEHPNLVRANGDALGKDLLRNVLRLENASRGNINVQ